MLVGLMPVMVATGPNPWRGYSGRRTLSVPPLDAAAFTNTCVFVVVVVVVVVGGDGDGDGGGGGGGGGVHL